MLIGIVCTICIICTEGFAIQCFSYKYILKNICAVDRQELPQSGHQLHFCCTFVSDWGLFDHTSYFQVQSIQWPLTIHWRKGKKLPAYSSVSSVAVVDGVVYCSIDDLEHSVVQKYNMENGNWSKLPKPQVSKFAMTSFEGQLILAGGEKSYSFDDDRNIWVWDDRSHKWVNRYKPMPTAKNSSVAVGYEKYLFVIGGSSRRDEVEVFNSSKSKWHSPEPLPLEQSVVSVAIVHDCLYLYTNSFKGKHIIWAHLPVLVSSANNTTNSIWHELPTPPGSGFGRKENSTLFALHGHFNVCSRRKAIPLRPRS